MEAIDNCTDVVYNYKYNELGNIKEETRNGETFKSLEYDSHNRLAKTTIHTSDETLVYTPIYETRDSDGAIYADNAVKGMTLDGVFEQSVDKDKYGRTTKTALTIDNSGDELLSTEYGYLTSNSRLTNIVDTVTRKVNGYTDSTIKYSYDANGNITAIRTEDECDLCCGCNESVEYVYDGLNRLIRENNFALGKTYTYKYDAAGNILSKSTYAVTSGAVVTPLNVKLYKYAATGWKDRLISYDGYGITYDTQGNPLIYRGHTLEWSRIRLLTKWDDTEMEYDASGIRTRKGNTTYELDGSSIISETTNGNTIRYYYGNGGIVGFRYNGSRYYYEKNLQGDITGIYDADGNKVGAYIYDAWGNVTITTDIDSIASVNPFRYRSYYYDSETGLYYVASRYYDPAACRFINADEVDYLGANEDLDCYNLFSYCANSPINNVDSTGNAWWHWAIGAAVVAACAVATVATCGGFAAAATAVGMVASGGVAFSTATTVAAGAFVGSSVALGSAAMYAASLSDSIDEFYDQGNWGTVASIAIGGIGGAYYGYVTTNAHISSRGSTATKQPTNLTEKLALEQVKSNPQGKSIQGMFMSDPRWAAAKGWVKMQQIVDTSIGQINIHYVQNVYNNATDDFKLK